MKLVLVITAALLSGCVPAANLIDTGGLLTQMRGEIQASKPPTARQALDSLCNAPYQDVVATLGVAAKGLCD